MTTPTLTTAGLRAAFVTLVTNRTPAGTAVYDSRQIGMDHSEFPVLTVESLGHTQSKASQTVIDFERRERVGVCGVVTGANDAALATAMDAMAEAIEAAVLASPAFTGAIMPEETQTIRTIPSGAKHRMGLVTVVFSLSYYYSYAARLDDYATHEEVAVTSEPTQPSGPGNETGPAVFEVPL